MKIFTCNGYAIITILSIILTSSFLYSQSTIVYDIGTSIDVGTGADVCSDSITVNGTYSGSGTFCNGPIAVENDGNSETPKEFSLSQNYPNPFNPSTVISWQLPVSSYVLLKVYNILGSEVATLVNENKEAGFYETRVDGSALASGMYIYRIVAGNYISTKKMLLIK